MNTKAIFVVVLIVLSIGATTVYAQEQSRSARLYIEQDSYVPTDVGVDNSGQLPLYTTSGAQLRITPLNFNHSVVVDYGLTTQTGSLNFDGQSNEYVLDAEGANGTLQAFWIVRETIITEEGNETFTESVRVRYAANIRVSDTTLTHVEPASLQETRNDAQNWTALIETIRSERVAGPDAVIQDELDSAIGYLRLVHNPWAALTGQFTGILLTLFLTLGGLLVLALFALYHIASTWYEKRYIHQVESLESDRQDVDEIKRDLLQEKREQVLANKDWNDIFQSDHVAAAFRRSFGENVLQGWLKLQEILLPETLIKDRLTAMGLSGYDVAIVEGDGDEYESARILPKTGSLQLSDEEEHRPIQELEEEEVEKVVDVLSWKDPELINFDMTEADFDRDEIGTILDSPNVDRLMRLIDQQVGSNNDFDTRKAYLEYMTEFVRDVRNHEYTDHEGSPRPIRSIFEMLLEAAHQVSGKYSFPQAEYAAEDIELVLMNQDLGADVAQYADEVEGGKHG